jgi:peroxiredoxin
MKKNIALFIVIAVSSALIGVYFALHRLEPQPPDSSASNTLFALTLSDAQGRSQPLSQWQGKILVVNFWATWCPPCVEEMPELVDLQKEMASRNIQVVGIGIDSASNISEFAQKHKIDYPLYIAGATGTELSKQLGNQIGALPFTVVINVNGKIEKTYLGRLKFDRLRQDLLSL